jgi:hypothetical protein
MDKKDNAETSELNQFILKVIKRIYQSDTLVVIIIPLILYGFNYAYIQGKFEYYLIPFRFYDFSFQSILNTLGSIMMTFFILYGFKIVFEFIFYKRLFRNVKFFWRFALETILFFIFYCLIRSNILFIKIPHPQLGINIISALFLTLVYHMVFPPRELGLSVSTFFLKYSKSEKIALASFYLLVFFLAFYIIGYFDAESQVDFVIAETNPECVILSDNGYNSICYYFDRQTKTFYRKFTIIDMTANTGLVYHEEYLGNMVIIPPPNQMSPLAPTIIPTIQKTP